MYFVVFLEVMAFLLSVTGVVLIYTAIRHCRKSEFVPIYYFIALSLGSVALLSAGRLGEVIYGSFMLSSRVVQDLMISYVALFLFGALWQSYEASLSQPPYIDE